MGDKHDLNLLADAFAHRLADQVTATVLNALEPVIEKTVKTVDLCWSEEEAAGLLKLSTETLARKAKAHEIGFSYSIEPTIFDADGHPKNGRRVYLKHHLLNYLLRREVKPKTVSRGDLTAENVYEFRQKEAA